MSSRLVIGSGVDSTPDQFTFSDVTGATPSTTYTSATVTVTGLSPNIQITVNASGGTVDTGTSVLSGSFASSQTVTTSASGTFVMAARVTSSSSFSTEVSVTVTINGVSDTYNVTTAAQDTTPDSFTFTNQTGTAKSSYIESNIVTVTGITGSVTVSASGNSGQVSVDGGGYTSSTTITNGQSLRVRVYTGSSSVTAYSTTVTVGTYSTTFTATTGDIASSWTSLGNLFGTPNVQMYYVNGRYFAIYGSSIWQSTNLTSWSSVSTSGITGLVSGINGIVYASGAYFVTAWGSSSQGVVYKSTNLSSWTLVYTNSSAGSGQILTNGTEVGVTASNNGNDNLYSIYSTGGATSFTRTNGYNSKGYGATYYQGGYHFFRGEVDQINYASTIILAARNAGTFSGYYYDDLNPWFAYGNGVAVMTTSGGLYYSSSLTSWSLGASTSGRSSIQFGGGVFYAMDQYKTLRKSTNGSSWTTITNNFPEANSYRMLWNGTTMFAISSSGTCYYST